MGNTQPTESTQNPTTPDSPESAGSSDSPQPPDSPVPARLQARVRWVLAGYWLLLTFGTHWPRPLLPPPDAPPTALEQVLGLDKLAHLLGLGGLMLLIYLSGLFGGKRSRVGRASACLGVALGYAVVNETTQGLLPERELSVADLACNVMGILWVYICILLPRKQVPGPKPKLLQYGLVAALPVLAVLVLTKWAWRTLYPLYMAVVGDTPLAALPMDSLFHAVASLVVATLLFIAWPMYATRPRRAACGAIFVMVATAPGVEVLQHFSGRQVEVSDMLAHWIGVVVAMTWWAARLAQTPALNRPATPASAAPPPA